MSVELRDLHWAMVAVLQSEGQSLDEQHLPSA